MKKGEAFTSQRLSHAIFPFLFSRETLVSAKKRNSSLSSFSKFCRDAYLLVWAWQEHQQAAKQLGESVTPQITFLIDEIESHLHPSWQRSIVPTLLSVMRKLDKHAKVQLITATHSPLVMASVEPLFDANQDAWFDLDLCNGEVALTQRVYEKQGDVINWLTSEAFDLKSGRPKEYETLVSEASALLMQPSPDKAMLEAMYQRLLKALKPTDEFLFRWRAICDKKGWLS